MDPIYVQFADTSETTVISFFSCPQDPSVWPNQGVLESDDERWRKYFTSLPDYVREGLPDPT